MIYIDGVEYYESDNDEYRSAVIDALETRPCAISEYNAQFMNVDSNSIMLNMYTPNSVAFKVLGIHPYMLSGGDLFIKTSMKNYVKDMNDIRPTHTLILPCVYNRINVSDLDLSNCEQVLIGSDLTPDNALAFLRMAGAKTAYSVYGSTITPPIVAFTEADNHYRWENINPHVDVTIKDGKLHVRWKYDDITWISDDLIEETYTGFKIVEKRYQCI